jgi:hypothetical protein
VPRHFVSEAIEPKAGSFDPATIARGEPSLPSDFTWRGEEVAVAEVRKTWRSHKVDRGDKYVKRHYFEFLARDGRTMTVYCERQAKTGAPRWWLYALADPNEPAEG